MPSAAEYADTLRVRLPEGPAWSTSDQTDGSTAWDGLLSALSQEPARIDADVQALLDKVIPDNDDTDLDAWERIVGTPITNLTDAERLARIRGLLQPRGQVNLETLQDAVRAMAGDDNVVLYNRAMPKAGASEAGAGHGCGSQGYEWLVELYVNTLVHQLDAAWTVGGSATATVNAQQSPVTLDQTATEIAFAASAGLTLSNTLTCPNDEDFYFSFWLRARDGDSFTTVVKYVDRSGATVVLDTFTLTNVWRRYFYRGSAGSGGSDPVLKIVGVNGKHMYMSWSCGAPTDSDLEARIRALFPIHTRGWIGIQGEFATLQALAPEEVGY